MRLGELVAAGRTSDVFALGNDAVVKVPRPEVPSDWSRIEALLGGTVARHGLPVPAVRDLVELEGRSCIVFDRVEGPSMWQRALDQPGEAAQLAVQLVDVQHQIHSAGIPPGVPDLAARLVSKVDACDAIDDSEQTEARQLIAGLPSGAALLHGDLHPGNVLMTDDGPVVIDWFDAAVGHPLADVLRTSLLMRPHFAPADHRHLPGATEALLRTTHDAYLDRWRELLTFDDRIVGRWEAVLAIARMSEKATDDVLGLLEIWIRRPSFEYTAGSTRDGGG